MEYLLLTVARDEERFLPRVIEGIVNQSHPPSLWMTVDDGSNDKTGDILNSIEHDTIFRRLDSHTRDIGYHWGRVLADSSRELIQIAEDKNIQWEAFAIVEGDAIIDKDYYEVLCNQLKNSDKLGIISGEIEEVGMNKAPKHRVDLPWGAATLYSKECLESIGGLSPTPSHESVEVILAQSRGFVTQVVTQTKFKHLRPMGSSGGWFRGHSQMGGAAKWLGLPFSFALIKGIKMMVSSNPKKGLGYLNGYLRWNMGRCEIPEVIQEYQNRWGIWNKQRKLIPKK